MKIKAGRVEEKTKLSQFLESIHKYAYLETLSITILYLGIGYLLDPGDICLLNSQVSFMLIIIAIITLFHGFENGLLSVGVFTFAMWFFYPSFMYVEFLSILMMTLIFSEFHYYWTQKIKEATINSEYKNTKLDELSRAFYTLKISHDQLEKNYVVKPMSIRNSIEKIIQMNNDSHQDQTLDADNNAYYKNFLTMLEKSFNVNMGLVLYKQKVSSSEPLTEKNALISFGANTKKHTLEYIFNDYLVDQALSKKKPIYISDDFGEPNVNISTESTFIAVIPSIIEQEIVSVLVIERMPFMAFNRETLTSISILLEYFALEMLEKNTLKTSDSIPIINDKKFRYEYARLKHLHGKYKVDSIVLVLRLHSELQSIRVFDKVKKMLRSLDMVTLVQENDLYYITLLFPLHDKSAALGYLNRLLYTLEEEKDKQFNYMTFNMKQTDLLNKYLKEDYDG